MPSGTIDPSTQMLLFIAFAAAFAIKVPMWPCIHGCPMPTWKRRLQVLLFWLVFCSRWVPMVSCVSIIQLFPNATVQAAPWIALLATIGIIYGAAVSYAQADVKKLVAYSSVSHLGFVMLGLFALNAQGVSGAILQMINHGISTGALFLLIGMVYEQTHTREIKVYGGLWKIMPIFGTIMLISSLSSMGLPGLNGFVGEFTILLGAFGGLEGAIGSALVSRGSPPSASLWRRSISFTCSRKCSLALPARSHIITNSKTSTGARYSPLLHC